MQLLASWTLRHGDLERRIELLHGDLSQIPPQQGVDILVVSAFPNDYLPTPTSLIGALYRRGISVAQLAQSKQLDMRQDFSCWLSLPVIGASGFRRILCIESGWRGTPHEITDDLFRALAPICLTEFANASVAMPIIGAGDQREPAEKMLETIVRAAASWIKRGLQISALKIVLYAAASTESAALKFAEIQREEESALAAKGRGLAKKESHPQETKPYDVFVSYCHEDWVPARTIAETLTKGIPNGRIFYDHTTLVPGRSWLMDIAESLDHARRVVALFTPQYWSSRYCKDEFAAALTRQHDTGEPILFPIYFRSADIPYLFRNLQYADCREGDSLRLTEACGLLSKTLI